MSSKLNSDDIERMKADAEKYKEYDAEILEKRNSINKFYALIDSFEDQVSKLDESVKAEVQAKIDEYRTFCDNEVDNYDSVAIKEKYATAEKTLTEMIAGKMGGAAQGTSNPDVEEVL
ncbi:hypothetical protein A0H76_502 [Hepatospora eriocheir]|uniref:Uncharacterized protein n=1 Tax=Hepatospora eriocheir TaxID=1081669 RepID=A0A1X0QL49_9MICR|nr:hypothetical protein A0H76_502 [Hepatospora eriocheir]